MGRVVLPQPGLCSQVVGEFGQKAESHAIRVHRNGSGAGGRESDGDNLGRNKVVDGCCGFEQSALHRELEALEVVARFLAGDIGVCGDDHSADAAGKGIDRLSDLAPVGQVDDKAAAGAGAVVDTEGVARHGCGSVRCKEKNGGGSRGAVTLGPTRVL